MSDYAFGIEGNSRYFPTNTHARFVDLLATSDTARDAGNFQFQAQQDAPLAPTVALAGLGAGNVDNGTHSYKITFVTATGETSGGTASAQVNVVNKTTNGQVALSSIGKGNGNVTSRKVYRTVAGDIGNYLLVGTIADNTTTTFTDNIADASLGVAAPTTNTTLDATHTFSSIGIILPNNTNYSMLDNAGNRVAAVTMTTANNFQFNTSTVSGSLQYQVLNATGVVQFLLNSIERVRISSAGLTLGLASTTTGALVLANSGSALTTTIQAGVNITASRTYTWPTDFGAAGTVLTDAAGNGTLSWAASSSAVSWNAITNPTANQTLDMTTFVSTWTSNTAITNTTNTILTLAHDTSGTAAANFGTRILWNLESSTTVDRNAAALDVFWGVATDAGRRSLMLISTCNDTTQALTNAVYFGILPSTANFRTIWMGGVTPSGTNYTITSPGTDLYLNATGATDLIRFLTANGQRASITNTAFVVAVASSITSHAAGSVGLIVSSASTPTVDIFQVQNNTSNVVTVDKGGFLNEIISYTRVSTQFDSTSTTLANITGLTATVIAGKTYQFEAILFTDASTSGYKFAIGGTATATAIIYEITFLDDATNAFTVVDRETALGGSTGATSALSGVARIFGTITVNGAGTLTAQFAQNGAVAGTSSILVGSTFVVKPTL